MSKLDDLRLLGDGLRVDPVADGLAQIKVLRDRLAEARAGRGEAARASDRVRDEIAGFRKEMAGIRGQLVEILSVMKSFDLEIRQRRERAKAVRKVRKRDQLRGYLREWRKDPAVRAKHNADERERYRRKAAAKKQAKVKADGDDGEGGASS